MFVFCYFSGLSLASIITKTASAPNYKAHTMKIKWLTLWYSQALLAPWSDNYDSLDQPAIWRSPEMHEQNKTINKTFVVS